MRLLEITIREYNLRGKKLLELQNRLARIEETIEEFISEHNEKELSLILQIVRGESH